MDRPTCYIPDVCSTYMYSELTISWRIQVDSQMKDAIKEIIVEFWMTKHILLRY